MIYAEIGVTTNFSFLRGASHPQEYVHKASRYCLYAIGIAAYGIAVFPVFALFDTRDIWLYAVGMVLVFGVVHAMFYGAQGSLYASLFPARIRYTGLSTVYQLSGVYASGLTPLILTALIGVAGGTPWLACGYLVVTATIAVVATLALKPTPLTEL